MRKPSPATAISLVALFFSLTGAGLAASRYLITSKSQIKPSVLRALKGDAGPQGTQGIPGSVGSAGTPAKNSIVGTALWFAPPGASVQSEEADMTPQNPIGNVVASCPNGSYALEGGYTGNNEIVTDNAPGALAGPAPPSYWLVNAHLESGQSSGFVIAWAVCVPLLPPN